MWHVECSGPAHLQCGEQLKKDRQQALQVQFGATYSRRLVQMAVSLAVTQACSLYVYTACSFQDVHAHTRTHSSHLCAFASSYLLPRPLSCISQLSSCFPSPTVTSVQIVYHGPREKILPFFESLNLTCPPGKPHADFLQEITSAKDQGVSVGFKAWDVA